MSNVHAPHRSLETMTRLLRPIVVAVALMALAALPAAAQDAPAPRARTSFPIFFDFMGTWRGEGTFGGWPARTEMTWGSVMDSRYIRVTWKSDLTTKSGELVHFEGEGTYSPTPDVDNHYAGIWFDSQSTMRALVGRVAGDSLSGTWDAEGTQGRTTYRIIDRNTIRVHDEIRRGDEWRSYGVSTLVRQPAKATPPTH